MPEEHSLSTAPVIMEHMHICPTRLGAAYSNRNKRKSRAMVIFGMAEITHTFMQLLVMFKNFP
jgi:hypothetical protein